MLSCVLNPIDSRLDENTLGGQANVLFAVAAPFWEGSVSPPSAVVVADPVVDVAQFEACSAPEVGSVVVRHKKINRDAKRSKGSYGSYGKEGPPCAAIFLARALVALRRSLGRPSWVCQGQCYPAVPRISGFGTLVR